MGSPFSGTSNGFLPRPTQPPFANCDCATANSTSNTFPTRRRVRVVLSVLIAIIVLTHIPQQNGCKSRLPYTTLKKKYKYYGTRQSEPRNVLCCTVASRIRFPVSSGDSAFTGEAKLLPFTILSAATLSTHLQHHRPLAGLATDAHSDVVGFQVRPDAWILRIL